jgi:hypothetical protein
VRLVTFAKCIIFTSLKTFFSLCWDNKRKNTRTTYLCAISLLRVWIDFIDSSGSDWNRFPDISSDIREWVIKLRERNDKKRNEYRFQLAKRRCCDADDRGNQVNFHITSTSSSSSIIKGNLLNQQKKNIQILSAASALPLAFYFFPSLVRVFISDTYFDMRQCMYVTVGATHRIA